MRPKRPRAEHLARPSSSLAVPRCPLALKLKGVFAIRGVGRFRAEPSSNFCLDLPSPSPRPGS
eukprot:662164-Alexandrium_andersonii.AAC.1